MKDNLLVVSQSASSYMNIINDCLPYIHATNEEICVENGLVDYWIDLCAREGEPDGNHTPE
jgi:hypothetical protein